MFKVVKTLTPEELLGLTDIEGSALSRNLGSEVYIPSRVKDYHHKSCIFEVSFLLFFVLLCKQGGLFKVICVGYYKVIF